MDLMALEADANCSMTLEILELYDPRNSRENHEFSRLFRELR